MSERARPATATLVAGLAILLMAVAALSSIGVATNSTHQATHAQSGVRTMVFGQPIINTSLTTTVMGSTFNGHPWFNGTGWFSFAYIPAHKIPGGDAVFVWTSLNGSGSISQVGVTSYSGSSIQQNVTLLDCKNKGIHQWADLCLFETPSWVSDNGTLADSIAMKWYQTSGTTTIGLSMVTMKYFHGVEVVKDNQGSKGPDATVTLPLATTSNYLLLEGVSEGNATQITGEPLKGVGTFNLTSACDSQVHPLCAGTVDGFYTPGSNSVTMQAGIASWNYWDAIAIALP